MNSRADNTILIGIFSFVLLTTVFTQGHGNEHGQATATVGDGTVSVAYHSPLAKGRNLLSMVQPGIYWRMGADSPTILTTEVDLLVGDTTIPQGEYVLWAHFEDTEHWSLALSTSKSFRQVDPDTIVAEIPGAVSKIANTVEEMTIELTGQGKNGTLTLEWGTARLTATFKAA